MSEQRQQFDIVPILLRVEKLLNPPKPRTAETQLANDIDVLQELIRKAEALVHELQLSAMSLELHGNRSGAEKDRIEAETQEHIANAYRDAIRLIEERSVEE